MPGDHYQVESRGHFLPGQPEGLTVETAQAIAARRRTYLTRNGETQAQVWESVFANIDKQQLVAGRAPPVVDALEIGWPAEVFVRPKS
jgi:hypothetical protein